MDGQPGHPVAVLTAVAVAGVLLLGAAWQWADAKTESRVVAAAVPVGTVEDIALATPVLSFRRAPAVLSRNTSTAAFADALEPLLTAVGDSSCLAVSVDGQTIAAKNELLALIPASNVKLIIAAVALDVLGADFRFVTRVVGDVDPSGTVNGDLFMVGGGDPLLSTDWWPTSGVQKFSPINTTRIEDLADRIVAAGVSSITGRVVGDASRYDDEYYAPSWATDVQVSEAGPFDALLVNDARPTPVTVANDPAQGAADVLWQLLKARGVVIGGSAVSGTAPVGADLASIESQPLGAILQEMLTTSDNNTAEMLVKEIGVNVLGQGTREAGLGVVRDRLATWGIPTDGLVFADGSGLSNDNRLTCAALIGVLQHGSVDDPVGAGLGIAATTGTLADLFGGTAVAGVLRAKTGTLNNDDSELPAVKSLSGYLPIEGGGAVEFALILTGQTISNQSEYQPIWYDRLAPALASYPAAGSVADLAPR